MGLNDRSEVAPMDPVLAYRGRSAVEVGPGGSAVALSSNLGRDPVGFDAAMRDPGRFREAFAAFHDALIGPTTRPSAPTRPGRVGRYWMARRRLADDLKGRDPRSWRATMPSDPVVTVAPDVLLFEGFAADGSTYAALTIDRDGFDPGAATIGTAEFDAPRAFLDGLAALRDDLPARLRIGPTREGGDSAEREFPALPSGWLRGFSKLQGALALALPGRRVALGREGLHAILAFLARHRAGNGPTGLRFDREPGRPSAVVLEPWERRITLHDRPDDGPGAEVIRVRVRDRLRPLARLLPMVDGAEVFLLGDGLPSFWSARMGGFRLLIGLAGRSGADHGPPAEPGRYLLGQVAASFGARPAQTLAEVASRSGGPVPEVLACLVRLAESGQVVRDPFANVYRRRPLRAGPITAEMLGPEDPEAVAARQVAATDSIRVDRDEARPDGLRLLEGRILDRPVSMVLDPDGRVVRGRCTCSRHASTGLKAGPCRHLLALGARATARPASANLAAWAGAFGG